MKDTNNTRGLDIEPDVKERTLTDYDEFFQNRYEHSMKADSTKADVRPYSNMFDTGSICHLRLLQPIRVFPELFEEGFIMLCLDSFPLV